MALYIALIVASFKMFYRNRQAVFFTSFFPLVILVIFGLLNFDKFNKPEVGLVNLGRNEATHDLILGLYGGQNNDSVLEISRGNREELLRKLKDGDLDVIFIIPEEFGVKGRISTVEVVYDDRREQERDVAIAVLDQSLKQLFISIANVPHDFQMENWFRLAVEEISGEGQGYKGFVVAGITAMSIMQLGIFGVVFTIVRYRSQGVLRRLMAAPINPTHFLLSQVFTRLVILIIQTFFMLAVGATLLDVTIGRGELLAWVTLGAFALMGGALFISIGLAISGMSRTEESAAPLANIVAVPMMFLSGIFFPVDTMPEAVSSVASFLPLTYLADGIRGVAVEGADITEGTRPLIGLGCWLVISFLLATRLFRWE